MHFKVIGIVLLIAGAYFVTAALVAAEHQHNDFLTAQVQPLAAIFLVLLVRVLQAEKHHRDWLRQANPEKIEKPLAEDDHALQLTL